MTSRQLVQTDSGDVSVEESHQRFLTASTLPQLGRIHWYLLRATADIDEKCRATQDNTMTLAISISRALELTEFEKELGGDEIHWWIFKRETRHSDLKNRTKSALESAQVLKQHAKTLPSVCDDYVDLLQLLNEFVAAHTQELSDVEAYLRNLHAQDSMAPAMLFTYRVWGSTRLHYHSFELGERALDKEHPQTISALTEIVLGLQRNCLYAFHRAAFDVWEQIADYATEPIESPPKPSYRQISRQVRC